MSDAFVFTNEAKSTLASPAGGGSTSLALKTGEGSLFPSITAGGGEKFEILVQSGSTLEYMTCTARAGDTLTVTRTGSNSFAAGSSVKLVLTATAANAFLQKGVMRQVLVDPNGSLAALYTGEEVLNTVNNQFYKHLTGTVWDLVSK